MPTESKQQAPSRQKQVNDWMVRNDLFQCTGCKGYCKTEYQLWLYSKHYGTVMDFCTEECVKEVDA